ncbi:hypothetical protein O9993_13915 [Vibrio lentus]|nr:hypothetical protein [Vibrio lentus]
MAAAGIVAALTVQLSTGFYYDHRCFGWFHGIHFRWCNRLKETHDVFTKGVHMMAMIGFIMIAAAGLQQVMKQTSGVGCWFKRFFNKHLVTTSL